MNEHEGIAAQRLEVIGNGAWEEKPFEPGSSPPTDPKPDPQGSYPVPGGTSAREEDFEDGDSPEVDPVPPPIKDYPGPTGG